MKKMMKRILAVSVPAAIGLVALSATAGFTVVDKPQDKPPIPPQVVIEEGSRLKAENERLTAEVERLKSDLSRVQFELTTLNSKTPDCSAKLVQINQTLDDIEKRLEAAGIATVRVNFPFGNAAFQPTKEVGDALVAAGKKARRVSVLGHTDHSGADEANRLVALSRAVAAKRFLTDNGVESKKVSVYSRGSSKPIGDNATEKGRAENRRVDVVFFR
jgi:OOP family OmpA-OmpF porin